MRSSRLLISLAAFAAICFLPVTTAHPYGLISFGAMPNSPPVAVDDNYTVHGSLFVPGNSVLNNDTDPDGDSLHLANCGNVAHGTLNCLYQYNAFSYEPNLPYVGADSFTYQACDQGACTTATVHLNVVNNAPIAVDDAYTLHGSLFVAGPNALRENDSDPDGDPINVASYTQASHGTFVYSYSYGSITYTPTFGYVGSDSITYQLCDNLGLCADATASFNTVNQLPTPVDDVYIVRGGTFNLSGPNALRENDSDPDGDPFSVSSYTQTSHGTVNYYPQYGSLSYTPNQGYNGSDSFTYHECDNLGACADASVTFLVIGNGENNGTCPTCLSGGPVAVGGPVNVTNGNMYLQQGDYALPGVGPALNLTRTYNSESQSLGLFGRGWSSDYDESIAGFDSNMARLNQRDGRTIYLARAVGSTGVLAPLEGDFHGSLVQNGANGFTLSMTSGDVHQFNSAGKVISLADSVGNQTTLTYDTGGKLTSVTDPFGRVLSFTTNTNGQVLSISDTVGTIATYTYGGSNQLSSVTYADNSAFTFAYDGNLQLTSVTDALGNVVESHTYDSQGRAITSERQGGVEHHSLDYVSATETDVTDALSHVTKFTIDKSKGRFVVTSVEGVCSCGGGGSEVQAWTYDDKLNVTAKTDARNHSTTFTYDSNGNPLTQTDATGTVSFTYNQFSEVLTRTDQLEGVTTNTYDTAGNLLTTKDALNHTTTFTRDSHGHPLTITDARGKVTTFTWDSGGRLTQAEDALNQTTDFSYDARARLTAVTNALNETTNYEYDAVGRLKKTTFPDSSFVEYTYDLAGRRTKVTDPRGNDTNFAYDSAYRLTSVTDALSHTSSQAYDAMSNPTSMTDALSRVTNYEYDDFNRLKKVIYPPATTGATRLQKTVQYDANGNIIKKTDTAGRETTYAYDDVNRLIATTDADDKTTTFQHDELSRTTAVMDALNQEYVFAYDAVGRQTQMTRGGVSMSYAYDAVGNRTERTDYNGATTTYEYDDLNRLTAIAYPDSTGASYNYDALSRPTTAVNENGTVSFVYDSRGRVASTTDVFNQTVAYTYDANGNRTAMALNKSDYAFYSYDELNRLTELSDSSAVAASYAYDAVSRPTSRTLLNGVASSYEYDGLDRLTRLRDLKDTTAILDNQYAYDNASQIVQNAGLDSTNDYTHDVVDRLITASAAGEEYSYDAVGNRTTGNGLEYGYGAVNRLETRGSVQYSHDANGNQLGRSFGSAGSSYTYDFENRLTHVSIVGTLGRHPTTITVDYKYDALGRRIERSPSNGDVQKFVYDGQDVVQDLDDNEQVVASYLNGPGIDNKIRQTDANGNVYFTTDHLGSTRALTDDSGSVVEQIDYDSFGNTEGSSLTRYTYTGREFDDVTGLYYYRARWYDADAGRFISEDPIGLDAGINPYVYVENDPVGWADPSGLCRCGVKVGPEYFMHVGFHGVGANVSIGGTTIHQGTKFYWHAEFLNDATHKPECCVVRQLISWNKGPFGPNTVPHAGFPPWAQPGTWLEDRNDHNLRYGRRKISDPHFDPLSYGDYHGNEFDSDDQPNGAGTNPGFALRFRLIVVDVCQGGKRIYTSKTITVKF